MSVSKPISDTICFTRDTKVLIAEPYRALKLHIKHLASRILDMFRQLGAHILLHPLDQPKQPLTASCATYITDIDMCFDD